MGGRACLLAQARTRALLAWDQSEHPSTARMPHMMPPDRGRKGETRAAIKQLLAFCGREGDETRRDGGCSCCCLLGCGNQRGNDCRFIGGARGSGASRPRPGGSAPWTRGGCPFGELRARAELIRSGCSAAESAWAPTPRQPWSWPSDLSWTVGWGSPL
jgi:hypothetical protein